MNQVNELFKSLFVLFTVSIIVMGSSLKFLSFLTRIKLVLGLRRQESHDNIVVRSEEIVLANVFS